MKTETLILIGAAVVVGWYFYSQSKSTAAASPVASSGPANSGLNLAGLVNQGAGALGLSTNLGEDVSSLLGNAGNTSSQS